MRYPALVAALALAACADKVPPAVAPAPTPGLTFDDDLAFLRAHGPVDVLTSPGGGVVAVSAHWQGRVMTSAVEPHGASLGFIHRAFLAAGKTGTAFDNYGGEDRFWLGPEGGQFGLYFSPGAPFAIGSWQTPRTLQEGDWEVKSESARHVTFAHRMHLENWSHAVFDVAVERTVRVLSAPEVEARFGAAPPPGTKWVAFESDNSIVNAGTQAWTRDTGLLSVWILGMYAPAADARILVPFDTEGAGPVVNDAYFGKIPAERLHVHERQGWMELVGDGQVRGKLGVGPTRARSTLGSFTASAHLLTLVAYSRPTHVGRGYVNSAWAEQSDPYAGDVVNAYNDGPTGPGQPSLGGFYEMETSSPAAALAPGESMKHVHATLHVVGDDVTLESLARKVLGVPLKDVGR